jgi:hypothetical protein
MYTSGVPDAPAILVVVPFFAVRVAAATGAYPRAIL